MAKPILTKEIVDAAIFGFEGQKKKIDEQIAELRRVFPGASGGPISKTTVGTKRKMSAAGREAIAEAQRKRWAAVKGERTSQTKTAKKSPKRLSPEGRAAIVAALKKRWAAKKAARKK